MIIIGVELAVTHMPQSIVAVILLGTVSGMAGTLFGNVLAKVLGDSSTPSEISKPTYSMQSAFFVCLFYYIATDPHGRLFEKTVSEGSARFGAIMYLVIHAVTVQFTGPFTPFPINFLDSAFFLITRIKPYMEPPKVLTKEQLNELADEVEKKKRGTKDSKKTK